jgi:hypothetical protein
VSDGLSIEITGVSEAIDALARRGEKGIRAIQSVTKENALNVQTIAKSLCPVDTGRLRSSIRTRSYNDWLGADIYTDVSYAPYVEFGTGERGAALPPPDSPGGYDLDWPGQYAQPFMYPAVHIIEPLYLLDLIREIRLDMEVGV